MIDKNKRYEKERAKDKQRRRIHVEIDPDNYDYIPEVKQTDYYDNDVPQRVAIYVRVSTDDVRQTTSFELQKKYYEDFVVKHPHWTLVMLIYLHIKKFVRRPIDNEVRTFYVVAS